MHSRAADLRFACVIHKEVAKKRARWRDPRMKDGWNAVSAALLEGVGAVTSVWSADQCNQYLGQDLISGDEREHVAQVRPAKVR